MSKTKPPLDSPQRPAPARLASASESSVAVVSEPMTDTSGVVLETLEAAADRGRDSLFVATARGVGRLPVPDSVTAIDATPGDTPGGTVSVSSPGDLTGLGIPVSRFLDGAERPVVAVDSLTSLLLYNEPEDVFRFLTILASQVARNDGLLLALVDEDVHDEQTARTFAQLFDGQVSLRDGDDGLQARGSNVGTMPPEWIPAR